MRRYSLVIVLCLVWPSARCVAEQGGVEELLDRYARSQERCKSWILKGEQSVKSHVLWAHEPYDSQETHAYDIRVDGVRVRIRYSRWGKLLGRKEPVSRDDAPYQVLLWDGDRYLNYSRPRNTDSGFVSIQDEVTKQDLVPIRYGHGYACLFGYLGAGTSDRIDKIIREARVASVRPERDEIEGVPCYVIDAETEAGDCRLWLQSTRV